MKVWQAYAFLEQVMVKGGADLEFFVHQETEGSSLYAPRKVDHLYERDDDGDRHIQIIMKEES